MRSQYIKLGAGVLATIIFVVVFIEIPVLFGRGAQDFQERYQSTDVIELSGNTVFLSDFHFTSPVQEQALIEASDLDQIVIVGDFFHGGSQFERFGSTDRERIKQGLSLFVPESFEGAVYFVSAFTHDPQIDLVRYEYEKVSFVHLGKMARFVVAGEEMLAFHGNELHGGAVGGGLSWLGLRVGYHLPLERLARERFKIPSDTWIITGHSHVPAFDAERRLANTGSFAGVPLNTIFQLPVGTGVILREDTEPFPVQFLGIEPTLF